MKLGRARQQSLSVPSNPENIFYPGGPITLVITFPGSTTLSIYLLTPPPFIHPLRSVCSRLSPGVSNGARPGIQT